MADAYIPVPFWILPGLILMLLGYGLILAGFVYGIFGFAVYLTKGDPQRFRKYYKRFAFLFFGGVLVLLGIYLGSNLLRALSIY